MLKKPLIFTLFFLLIFSLFGAGCKNNTKYFVNITVTVKDAETDNPISGATVIGGGKTGSTDKSGVVPFTNMEGNQNYTFTVRAKDYADHTFSLDVKTQSLSYTALISKQKGSISGQIFDDKNNPVEEAMISIPNTAISTYSQPDGSFMIIDVPVSSNPYTLDINKEGYATRKIYNVYVTADKPDCVLAKIVLTNQPGRLSGSVTDEKGTSLPEVNVFIQEANKAVKTNNLGHFTVELLPGMYTVIFSHQHYINKTENYVELKSNAETTLNIQLEPKPGSLSGIVKDNNNKPIDNVLVTISGTNLSMVTDAIGYFLIENIPPGDYVVQFTNDYYKTETANVKIEKATERILGNVFMNPKTGSLNGRVVDKNDKSPIRGAIVRSNTTLNSTTTLTDGSFQLNNIRIGSHILTVTATDYSSTEVLAFVEEDKNITIPDVQLFKNPGSIYGTIRDLITKKAIEGATITVIEDPSNIGISDNKGIFTISNLAEGEYTLTIEADGYNVKTITKIQVMPQQTTNAGVIDLEPQPGIIQGVTTPGATINLQSTAYQVTASDTGDFILNNVTPGNYILNITKTNFAPLSQEITLLAGQNLNLGTLPLEPLKGSITGTVRDSITIQSIENANVSVLDNPSINVKTNSEGLFRIDNLLVGRYSLKIDYPNYVSQTVQNINVEANKTTNLNFINLQPRLCTVSGSTTPGAKVSLRFTSHNATANPAGSFAIENVNPGFYTVDIVLENYYSKEIPITLNPGETKDLGDQTLTPLPGRITGLTNADTVTALEISKTVTVENEAFTIDDLNPGTYTLKYEKPGYTPQTKNIAVTANGTTNAGYVTLEPITGGITGYIMCVGGNVTLVETRDTQFYNNPAYFTFRDLSPGTYHLTLKRPGYQSSFLTVTVEPGKTTNIGNINVGPEFIWWNGDLGEEIGAVATRSNNPKFTVDYPQTINCHFTVWGYEDDDNDYKGEVVVYIDGSKKDRHWQYGSNKLEVTRSYFVNNEIDFWDDSSDSDSGWEVTFKLKEDHSGPKITLSKLWDYGTTFVSISAEDNYSGLNVLQYSLSKSPTSAGSYSTISNGGSVSITSKGVWYLHIKVTDIEGNVSTMVEGPFIVP